MAVLIIILAIMTILKVNSIRKTTSSAYDILQKQRFVLVQDKNDWGKEWSTGVGFDLKDNYSTETAVIFGELVRNGSNWAFHSIGDGHQVDLNGLLAYFS